MKRHTTLSKPTNRAGPTIFQKLFSAIERALQDGDDEVQNLIRAGLLESIQNVALNSNIELGVFRA